MRTKTVGRKTGPRSRDERHEAPLEQLDRNWADQLVAAFGRVRWIRDPGT